MIRSRILVEERLFELKRAIEVGAEMLDEAVVGGLGVLLHFLAMMGDSSISISAAAASEAAASETAAAGAYGSFRPTLKTTFSFLGFFFSLGFEAEVCSDVEWAVPALAD